MKSCYINLNQIALWSDAEAMCQQAGGHLPVIENVDENEYIRHYISRCSIDRTSWIGYRSAGYGQDWYWVVDDLAVNFTIWHSGHPYPRGSSALCAVASVYGHWKSEKCASTYSSVICEIPSKETDAILYNWVTWTPCTVSCGGGIRSRHRQCSQPGLCSGNLIESDLCGDFPCPNSYTKGHNVMMSSTYDEKSGAMNAVDGHPWPRARDNSCSITRRSLEPWWMVDLGYAYVVAKIIITNRADCCGEYLIGAVVRVGNVLEIPKRNRKCGPTINQTMVALDYRIDIECPPVIAGRYVSIQLEDLDEIKLQLCEVEVFTTGLQVSRLICPLHAGAFADPGSNGIEVTWPEPQLYDVTEESLALIKCSYTSGTRFPIGKTEVTCQAKDPRSELSHFCSFVVTVTACDDKLEESCYYAVEDLYDQPNAEYSCQALGGALVSINSAEEHTFVLALVEQITTNKAPWIGYTDREAEGVWVWSDGTMEDGYYDWDTDQPDNLGSDGEDCAVIKANGKFRDRPCTTEQHSAICESPARYPVISCPDFINTFARKGDSETQVSWGLPTVFDYNGRLFEVECNPEINSTFILGETTVTCVARSSDGAYVSCMFPVTVIACKHRLEFSCFVILSEKKTFAESRKACWDIGTDLAIIKSPEENAFVTSVMIEELSGTPSAFIGMNDRDVEGQWMWIDGDSVNSATTFWKDGKPDNKDNRDCGLLLSEGTWSDNFCTRALPAVCEGIARFPIITCPSSASAFAREGTSTAEVFWDNPVVNDTIGRTFDVVCQPQKNSQFPLGSSNVTCVATTEDGTTLSCGFPVTVTACSNRLESNCYVFLKEKRTYSESRAVCQEIGADLVVIESLHENIYITSKMVVEMPEVRSAFIGMDDKEVEGDWVWINGDRVGNFFTNWKNGEPDKQDDHNCGLLHNDGQWSDNVCTKRLTAICETSTMYAFMDCPSDVVVHIDPSVTGAAASWNSPQVTDPYNRELQVTCEPSSGSEFLAGVTVVTCTAMYNQIEQATCSFNVEIVVCETAFESSCYFFLSSKKNFQESRDMCRAENADLVSIETQAERNHVLVLQIELLHLSALIGLNDIDEENSWRWIAGSKLQDGFQDWAAGEPDNDSNEDCVIMKTNGQWRDISCEVKTRAICELGISPLRLICPKDINLQLSPRASRNDVIASLPQLIDPQQREAVTKCTSSPESPSTFGTFNITCTVVLKESIITASCSYVITIEAAPPPTVTCPPKVTVFAREGTSSADVFWENPVVKDTIERTFEVVCDPKMNSQFPLGTTNVTCVATADDGVTSSCSFLVIVTACDNRLNSNCYVFMDVKRTFSESRTACQEIGSDLVVIDSIEENYYISSKMAVELPGVGAAFIGMNDINVEGDWVWVNGDRVVNSFTYWKDGEPDNLNNQDCGLIFSNGEWRDNICSKKLNSICEASTKHAFIDCPAEVVVYIDRLVSGATATWDTPDFTDPNNRKMQVICEPSSGSEFLAGVTSVTCKAMYEQSEQARCSFSVNVIICDTTFETSCYVFISSKQIFEDSRNMCIKENAKLVSIETQAERDYLLDLQNELFRTSVLIGLNDIDEETTWRWIDGSLLQDGFKDWASGEPNNLDPGEDCVIMKTSGQWRDVRCDAKTRAICEMEIYPLRLLCPNDTISPISPSASEGIVNYSVPKLIDPDQRQVHITCNFPSGSVFKLGTTEVTCIGTPYQSILTATCSFFVTVEVADPPTMTCPLRAAAFAREGTSSAEVSWESPEINDVISRTFDIVCNHEVYSQFPLGESDVLCVATAEDGVSASCSFPVTVTACENRLDSNCYVFMKVERGFLESRAACQEIGADLVVIESLKENSYITTRIAIEFPEIPLVYIGMDDIESEGNWFWVNGNPVGDEYENWKDGQPDNVNNQDCGLIHDDGQWSDNWCHRELSSICEKSTTYAFMECLGDVVVHIDQWVTGAIASWDTPNVTDPNNREMQVICYPSSGSEFLIGSTKVTCRALYDESEQATCSFDVNVVVCDTAFKSSCYKFITSKQSFEDSRDLCVAQNADLVSIETQAERDYLLVLQNELFRTSALIGLNDRDVENSWKWTDGSTLQPDDFQDWASGEPNNLDPGEDCVIMKTSGQWRDVRCDAITRVICELEMSNLQLLCPADITVKVSEMASGKIVHYGAPQLIDVKQREATIACSPSSGTAFESGVTNVTCRAVPDQSKLTAHCSFSVTLEVDIPVFRCPTRATAFAMEGTTSAEMVWDSPVVDDFIGRTFDIVCDREIHSQFPLGITNVTCVATAEDGVALSCIFPAIVTACDNRLQSNCYVFINVQRNFPESRAACQEIGADLLMIDSLQENSFITARIAEEFPDTTLIFLGIADAKVEGDWVWVNGDRVGNSFTNWKDGEPANSNDQNCGVITVDGQWGDTYCSRKLVSICESNTTYASMECPGDVVVHVGQWVTGAAASWETPNVTDPNDREMQVICEPSAGSELLIGLTTVTCRAIYDISEQATCSFDVNVVVCDTAFKTSCYKFITSKQVFKDSRDMCVAQNAELVSIETQAERDYLLALQNDLFRTSALIGLNDIDVENSWKWTDGATLQRDDFQDWASGEPNNLDPGEDCVIMKTSGQWRDVRCDAITRAICELEIPKLRLSCPDDIILPISQSASGGIATYEAPQLIDPDNQRQATITCSRQSGTVFPLGTTVVMCSGVPEQSILTASCSFSITLEVAPMPTVTCPLRATAFAREGTSTANVVWESPVVDDVIGRAFDVICEPKSDSKFQLGDSNVTCVARAGDGLAVSCNFLVTVTACNNRLGTNCYVFMNVQRKFLKSRDACQEIGADLLVIESLEENVYITSKMAEIPEVGPAFIGMDDIEIEGEWVWVNGDRVGDYFTNWKSGEPDNKNNQDCGLILSDGTWSDNYCSRELTSICETSTTYAFMECPSDIIEYTNPKVNGATASWDKPEVIDPNNRDMQVICEPSAGSEFLAGVTSVRCRAMYNHSEQAACLFNVNIIDCETAFEKSCYFLINSKQKFEASRDLCLTKNADLVSIETQAERDHILDLQIEMLGTYVLIGLNDIDVENSWRWIDGSLLQNEFQDWASGEPNNLDPGEDCVAMKTTGQWRDISCDARTKAICELELYPLWLTCPSDIDLHIKQGTSGKSITYSAPILNDPNHRQATVACSSPSGTVFPLGTTVVTCNAILKQSILTASCSFQVKLKVCEVGFLDSCYIYIPKKRTFNVHVSICQETGGSLIDIRSQEENDFLSANFQSLMGKNKVYAGLHYGSDSGWKWENGQGMEDFQNWDSSQPRKYTKGESCLSLKPNGKWVDQYCTTKLPTICEIDIGG
ncbi:uncharacterized protein LOC117110226 [Anneissia japonica]|uniref:uncharacterized protein LOC117110226 n=1 Tax=Anneissia japonica TaxID=1529436 RepID=UPI001425B78C|nr:uncharacterized protein LOC117110226 [Anneissia japonica]